MPTLPTFGKTFFVSVVFLSMRCVSVHAQCQFSITHTNTNDNCLYAEEEVVWVKSSASNVTRSGNTITKSSGVGSYYDGGAASVNTVKSNGWATATIQATGTTRIFGLSSTGPHTVSSGSTPNNVNYGFLIRGDNFLDIIEAAGFNSSGTAVSFSYNFTNKALLAGGSTLKISNEGGVIKYYLDGTLLRTSPVVPPVSMVVDALIQNVGASISNVKVYNGFDGVFTASLPPGDQGSAITYEWFKGGISEGPASASNTYTNTSLTTEVITCKVVQTGGCGNATSNQMTMSIQSASSVGSFYITSNVSNVSCMETIDDVTFTNLVNLTASGSTLTKISGNNSTYDAGATSVNTMSGGGYMEITIPGTISAIVGISSQATAANSADGNIKYGFNFASNSSFRIREAGNDLASSYSYNTGDIYWLKIENNLVRYYKNGTAFYTSLTAPGSATYVVDLSLNNLSSTLSGIRVNNGSTGTFTAAASNLGTTPTYAWRVGATPVGTNSASYTSLPGDLALNAVITCRVTPSLVGCPVATSNNITVNKIGGSTSPTTNWTGNTDTAWETAANWDNGVPTGYTKVVIPNGRTRYPVINAAAGVYDLSIGSTSSVTLGASNSLTIFDNLNNAGTFTPNTGTVNLKNCTTNKNDIQAPAAGQTFYNLTIDNSNQVDVHGEQVITNLLTLTNGVVNASATTDRLTINSTASVAGMSANSFVDGYVKKIGNSSFTFPIGDTYTDASNVVTKYLRELKIDLTGTTAATDAFTARYYKASATTVGQRMDPLFYTISGCEYWELRRNNGASDATVTLHWISADCPNAATYVTNRSELRVSRLDDSDPSGLPVNFTWQNKGYTSSSGSNTNGYVTSQVGVGAYGYFTLASIGSSNTLPIELVNFKAQPANNNVVLSWQTLSELSNDHFEIERSGNGEDFSIITKIDGAGTSSKELSYQYIDYSPLAGKNYYRLKQVDSDGLHSLSNVVRVDFTGEKRIGLYPNPAKQGQCIYLTSAPEYVSLIDAFNNRREKKVNHDGSIETADLAPGIYAVSDGQKGFFKIVIY